MAAKAKAKSKTAEKKKEYHLKDYLSMCKVNAVILDFKGLKYEIISKQEFLSDIFSQYHHP